MEREGLEADPVENGFMRFGGKKIVYDIY